MKKMFVSFFMLSAGLLSACSLSAKGDASYKALSEKLIESQNYQDTINLASSVEPAIVGIGASSSSGTSVGAGVCVAAKGYIITNSHVVNGANAITVYLSTGDTGSAKTVWEDTTQDLAIIKTNKILPYLPLSTSDLSVGEDVIAVGTPLSLILKHSFTKGIVSATNRTLKVDGSNGESYMQGLIQHDASLNPGNSGGPLLNLKGEVVGINTLKINGGEGIGFAIPSKSFSTLLSSVVASKTGYQTPYLGAYGVDGEIAKFNKLSTQNNGFYVLDIASTSPLKDAGISSGDTITKINNQIINNAIDLRNELYKYEYGDKIIIEYVKNGEIKEREIVLSKNHLR